ncbi:hypothetical protein D9C73_006981 [Collichthys lucidus]|uniref:Uncharacterized protein n=1 Tax=Collichthys lucidus TaxID=240159 RepID=A0A4U5UE25_COLLU|nr:hypothetical protein D9C73_006981 [Collichthys lucidus]
MEMSLSLSPARPGPARPLTDSRTNHPVCPKGNLALTIGLGGIPIYSELSDGRASERLRTGPGCKLHVPGRVNLRPLRIYDGPQDDKEDEAGSAPASAETLVGNWLQAEPVQYELCTGRVIKECVGGGRRPHFIQQNRTPPTIDRSISMWFELSVRGLMGNGGPDNPGETVTRSPQTGVSKRAQTSQRAPGSLDRSHHTLTSRGRTLENSGKHRHVGVSPRAWMEGKLIPGIP